MCAHCGARSGLASATYKAAWMRGHRAGIAGKPARETGRAYLVGYTAGRRRRDHAADPRSARAAS